MDLNTLWFVLIAVLFVGFFVLEGFDYGVGMLLHPAWRATWDWAIFFGSAVPALLWGVALGNLLQGVPIDQHRQYVGGFSTCSRPTR